MTFWEFNVACEGFEQFHSPSPDAPGGRAPSADAFWNAVGVTNH
jgi:hypothetical protein